MISDSELATIVEAEESAALTYSGGQSTLSARRQKIMEYYFQEKFGNEVEGQSTYITSDVMDVVETMTPLLVRVFTQPRRLATFISRSPAYEEEAEQKTEYAHAVFTQLHDGPLILHDMIKDGLLQYTGVVKVTWDKTESVRHAKFSDLSGAGLVKLVVEEGFRAQKIEHNGDKLDLKTLDVANLILIPDGLDVEGEWVDEKGHPSIENVPPNELVVASRARDFDNPPFIGQRTPRTRSELIEMGFDRAKVMGLSGTDTPIDSYVTNNNSDYMLDDLFFTNPTNDPSKDVIWLGEYYIYIDTDGDGVSELWQVFYADNQILAKERVDEHPYCVFTPIRLPHRTVGLCPADQVSDIQYLNSELMRQYLNNLYHTTFPRIVCDDRVNLEDLLTLRPGGVVRVTGEGGTVGAVSPLVVPNQGQSTLEGLSLVEHMREVRTGVTRNTHGLSDDVLSKTATEFSVQNSASMMRIDLMARLAAVAIKSIFEKIINLATQHQEYIDIEGGMRIQPVKWRGKARCNIEIGGGPAERQERVGNLNGIISRMEALMDKGSPLVDSKKLHTAYSKLLQELGFTEESMFINDPEVPEQLLMAELERLTRENKALQEQIQSNPIAEAETIKAQATLVKAQGDARVRIETERAKIAQQDRFHDDEMALKLTELELDSKQNIPGALV